METKYTITLNVSPAFIDVLAKRVAEELRNGQPAPVPEEDLPEEAAVPVTKTVREVVDQLKGANDHAAALIDDLGLVPIITDVQMRQAMITASEGVVDFKDKGQKFLRIFCESHRNPNGTIPVWTRVTKDIPMELRDNFLAGFYGYLGKRWEGVPAVPEQQ